MRAIPKLRRKMALAFAVPLLFSLLVSVASIFYEVDRLLVRQAQQRVAADLRSAREIYDARLERLKEFVHFGANLHSVRLATEARDLAALGAQLQALRVRQGADVFTVADARGRVLLRSRNPDAAGDDASHLGPVRSALVGEVAAGTEELTAADLARESEDLARRSRIPIVATPLARPAAAPTLDSAMCLVAAAPIQDAEGRTLGVLYAAEVLNRDPELVDRVRSVVFSGETYQGRPVGTATLFLRDIRVATNVLGADGQRAVGTRVSAAVARRVLEQKASWTDRAFVVNDWYLSAYEPITDSRGDVLGILYVGLLERPYRDLLWKTLAVAGVLHVAGAMLVLGLAGALARRVARPVGHLAEGARRIASGDLGHEIRVESDDEIGELAAEFNDMTAALRERDAAIDGLKRGLEAKVRERSSELQARNEELLAARSDLLAMMDKQRRTNEELAASLERLKATQEELVRSGKLAALGALAAGVAHEVNNPLAVIQGNLELLRLRRDAADEGREELDLIAAQTERMQKIVSSLLTFARREDARLEAADVNALVRETLALAAPQARTAGVALEASLAERLPAVRGDPSKLTQVFANLAVNALQASPRGASVRISTGVSDDGRQVYAAFADAGPGISPQERERVWNPFYTTKPAGTGLGLPISHAIVEEHGGRIVLESAPGRGTTFTVLLPLES